MGDPTTTQARWLVAAVVAAACVPYLSTVTDYFAQDDFGVVELMARRPWSMFPRWFVVPWTEDIWGYTPDELRPFVAFTYQLTGKWNPARPELHHLFNIALHAGNALLVMAIARTVMAVSLPAAAFAGVVFAVLPGQAESVAWVTGRVDSMPAFLYFATFLAYARWRHHRRWPAYAAALALFFVALFSKQNTITMVATLAAYDLLVLTRRERGTVVSAAMAWAPFAILTGGFLLLRRAIFGQSLRAGLQTANEVAAVGAMLGHHVRRTVTGHLEALSRADVAAATLVVAGLVVIVVRAAPGVRARFLRAGLVFGVIWFAIGVAPVALAGYESPRHAYLASAGWAFLLALIVDGCAHAVRTRALGRVVAVAAAGIVVLYAVRLVPVVQEWHTRAMISEAGVIALQQEAAAASPGTLLLVGLPRSSWEWSSPFVLAPPFAPAGLLDRVHLITPWRLHCCGVDQWHADTRRHLQTWLDTSPRPPIVGLHLAPETGAVSRVTDAQVPDLGQIVPVLLQTTTREALDAVIGDILEKIVAGRPRG
jgi:hypothetical protein